MSQPVNMPQANGDPRLKCGGCRWFVQGFQGKTCVHTRQVNSETRACIEFQPYKPSTFTAIEKDKFLIEMRKTMLVWTEDTIKNYDKDIRSYKIVVNDVTLKDPMDYVDEAKLAELSQKFHLTQIFLERLLELRFNIMDKCTELQSFTKEVQAYLFSEYRDHVQALKNESERNAFYRAAAPELFRAVDKMDNLQAKVDAAYQNLKDAHYNLKQKQDGVLAVWEARIHSQMNRNRTSG